MPLPSLNARDYNYVQEGRTHVVFSCRGSTHVLRLRKSQGGAASDNQAHQDSAGDDSRARVSATLAQRVWQRLLPPQALSHEEACLLPLELARGLNQVLLRCSSRPSHRIEPLQGCALPTSTIPPSSIVTPGSASSSGPSGDSRPITKVYSRHAASQCAHAFVHIST